LQNAAQANPADAAGMQRVVDAFDAHVGKANPLLNQARQMHSERMGLFEPQRTNATSGANTVLRALGNNAEAGQTVVNRLFGASLKRGEAGPLVDRLRTIYAGSPEAMGALKVGAIQRLMTDPRTGEALSPTKMATSIRTALGPNSPHAEVYRSLLSREEMARLNRFADLNEITNATARNPSKSSYGIMRTLTNHVMGGGAGAAVGGALGHVTGIPLAGEAGLLLGKAAGSKISDIIGNARGARSVRRAASNIPEVRTPRQPGRYPTSMLGMLAGQGPATPHPGGGLLDTGQ
jgi:hypothetical protein